MTEAEKWLLTKAEQYADVELIKIMPIIRKSIIDSYIKGFSIASIMATNSKKEEIKKEGEA
jgi:hypothetical protein